MAWFWLAFFLSGVAGLSYELAWLRFLTHIFGASTPALSATVAVFFTGLALGAWLGGRFFDAQRRPLLAYAGLEVCIGLSAALVPWQFDLLDAWLAARLGAEGDSPGLLLLGSFALLIVPTTLLGATFPGMAAVLKRLDNPTSSTGLFYGFNTLGAVVGCLASSFWFIPSYGQSVTTWGLAGINLFIAAGVVAWRARFGEGEGLVAAAAEGQGAAGQEEGQRLPFGLAAGLAGASGLFSIGIEVLWVRGLALSFPASVYVFSLVLSVFLMGIGAGSLAVGRRFQDRAPQVKALVVLYVVVVMGVWATMMIFPNLTGWSLQALGLGMVEGWGSYVALLATLAMAAMLPATLAMGAALPVLIGLATRGQAEAGRVAGRLYAINTLGGVVGSLAAGFYVMPALGVSRSLVLMTAGFGVMALALATRLEGQERRAMVLAPVAVVGLALTMLLGGLSPEINPLKERAGAELLFYQDDPSATVTIHDAQGVRALRLNNNYGLSNTTLHTVELQYTLGHLPMELHPAPKRALLIGFATGTTLAAMGAHDGVKLDCVELHELVIELGTYFEHVNLKVAQDPDVRIIAADGRRFVAAPGEGYDVIVGDLYLPRNPGVGSLFSLEHFQAAQRRLNPGGVFVAWLPLFQMGPQELASIARTFAEVFPEAEGWVGHWAPEMPVLGLVGRRAPVAEVDPGALEGRLRQELLETLGRIPALAGQELTLTAPPGSPSRRLLDADQLRALGQGAPLNSLESPFVEFSAPRSEMTARIARTSMGRANIEALSRVRSLEGTPWGAPPERGDGGQ